MFRAFSSLDMAPTLDVLVLLFIIPIHRYPLIVPEVSIKPAFASSAELVYCKMLVVLL